jgi:hypothetical protein
VEELFLAKNHAVFFEYCLTNAKIDNIYFMGAPPTGTYYNSWNSGLTVGTIHITDIETWLKNCEMGDYGWGNYAKNIINENLETVTELVVPESVTKFINNGTKNMKWLEKLTIPHHITSIAYDNFYGLYSLKDLHFDMAISETGGTWAAGNRFQYVGNSVEEGTTIYFGPNVRKIPDYFLDMESGYTGRRNITKLDFTNATYLSVIGKYAFRYCRKLSEIILPSTITTIQKNAF